LGFFVLTKFIIAFSENFETKRFNFLLYIRMGDILAFEVAKLHDYSHFWGAMNRALVYNTFFSFLENLDIDEFNIFWDIVYMGMINVFSFL
jgi:hypothetical protein